MQYADLTNDRKSQFYVMFTPQAKIFEVYTNRLQMCNNAVLLLLLLQLWSWNALFTVRVHCIELIKSSYGPEKH